MYQLTRKAAVGFTLVALLGLALPVVAGQVPFKGKAKGQITSVVPVPGGAAVTTVAEGNATHLGRFSREENLILDPASGTFNGSIVFTVANGDQLFGIVSGGFISETTAVGSYSFTGGTGRFSHAAGQAHFIVSTSDGIQFDVKFRGSID